MPNSLRELHQRIIKEAHDDGLSVAQALYAVGWIFFDIFERAEHEEKNNGVVIGPVELDRFAREIADSKIVRDISDAQQEFGRASAEFMEPEIQKRIRVAIDESIVSVVRSYTAGWKPFLVNVAAGVMAGVLFAGITVAGYVFVKIDPSVNAAAKAEIDKPNPTK